MATRDASDGDAATDRRQRSLAVVLLIAAPVFWLLQLLVSYALVPFSCRVDSDAPLYAVTAATAIVAAIVTATAIKTVRSAGVRSWRPILFDGSSSPDRDDRRTVILLAACLAAYFSLVVLMTALVAPIVDRCA